ncbi:MAG TPA: hypothetical protein VD969_14675 [Symbiobacteriaceae bacterium]|nr:hypothetical protein [Symbiobacteriaceae bacterium]
MLAVDWLGLGLTAAVTAVLLPERYRLLRSLLAMLIAECGRIAVTALVGGAVVSVTVAGAFTSVESEGPAHPLLPAAGMAASAAVAVLLSRRTAKDVLIYSLVAGTAILLLRGWSR